MIVFNNIDEDSTKTFLFFPGDKEGEFTIIPPEGENPADISPDALKVINLFAEAKKVVSNDDLEEFQKKLDAAFPKGNTQEETATAESKLQDLPF